MDSNAEPIVQAETPTSGSEEQVKQDSTHPVEAPAQPMDDDDAILAKLLGDDAADTVAEDAAPEAHAPEDSDPAESPAFDRDAVAKILKRDGVPDEVIASASPETLSKWAESASKRQKDVDSYGGRLKQMEEQLAKAPDAPKAEAQDNKPAPAAAAPEDPFAQMAETYGEDLVAPVRAAFQMQQQRMQEQILLAQARSADLALRAKFGAKAPSYDTVLSKMNELGNAKPGGYASVDALAAAAYEALVGSTPPPVNARAAQPTAPKSAPAPVKPAPRDEDDEILDRIISGTSSRMARSTRN